MMHLAGAFLIILALGGAGWAYAARYTRRIRELEDWQQALKWCEIEINYRLLPLPEVLELVGKRLDNAVGAVFLTCAAKIEKHQSAQAAWQVAIEQYLHASALTAADGEFLLRFGAVLGKSDLAQQNKNFAFLAENLAKALAEAERERAAKAKIYRYLGFSSGIALVLILF